MIETSVSRMFKRNFSVNARLPRSQCAMNLRTASASSKNTISVFRYTQLRNYCISRERNRIFGRRLYSPWQLHCNKCTIERYPQFLRWFNVSCCTAAFSTTRPSSGASTKAINSRKALAQAINKDTTIFAQSTAPGKAAIAVFRVSGPAALAVYSALCPDKPPPQHGRAAVRLLCDPADGNFVDECLVLRFSAPCSFTGEDVIELHAHGGLAIQRKILSCFESLSREQISSLRPAEPGEFSFRAFANNKMDLAAAEHLADSIDAESEVQRRTVTDSFKANRILYDGIQSKLLECRGLLEAVIDFGETDDIAEETTQQVLQAVRDVQFRLARTLKAAERSEKLQCGVRMAFIGSPNAGKSSLINFLADRAVSIVSAEAGTTRDVVEVHLDIAGYPVTVSDTAGIRSNGAASSEIELEGIRRARERAASSDIVVFIIPEDDLQSLKDLASCLSNQRFLVVISKCDLLSKMQQVHRDEQLSDGQALSYGQLLRDEETKSNDRSFSKHTSSQCVCDINATASIGEKIMQQFGPQSKIIFTSTVTGAGIDQLVEAIRRDLAELTGSTDNRSVVLLNHRHRQHLIECENKLQGLEQAIECDIAVAAELLRECCAAISKITGAVDTEQVLAEVFSRFCVGK